MQEMHTMTWNLLTVNKKHLHAQLVGCFFWNFMSGTIKKEPRNKHITTCLSVAS